MGVIAVAAAVGAVLAPPSPTGRPVVDVVLVGASAAAVTAIGSRAPWWILVLASAAAIAIAGTPVLIAVAAAGLVLAAASRSAELSGPALRRACRSV